MTWDTHVTAFSVSTTPLGFMYLCCFGVHLSGCELKAVPERRIHRQVSPIDSTGNYYRNLKTPVSRTQEDWGTGEHRPAYRGAVPLTPSPQLCQITQSFPSRLGIL